MIYVINATCTRHLSFQYKVIPPSPAVLKFGLEFIWLEIFIFVK